MKDAILETLSKFQKIIISPDIDGFMSAELLSRKFDSVVDPEVKVSVVFGDADLTLPEELAQEKSVLPRHAKWIRVPNCAHVIMWNHRETTIKLIKETAGV